MSDAAEPIAFTPDFTQCKRCTSLAVPLQVSLAWCPSCQHLRNQRREGPNVKQAFELDPGA